MAAGSVACWTAVAGGTRAAGRDDQGDRGGQQRRGVTAAQAEVDAVALAHQLGRPDAGGASGQRREHHDRDRPPDSEGGPDQQAERRVADREADSSEGPDSEGEDEGREAETEQHAVEGGGQRHRHHPAPVLRQLTADLRHDPRPTDLEHGCEQGDPGRHRVGGAARRRHGAGRPSQGERAEGDQPAGDRPGQEGRAGGGGDPPAARVAGGADRLDHREPAGREGPGRADQQRRDRQGDLERAHISTAPSCRSTGRRTPCGRCSSSRSARRPR